ncbi:hypothetical protein CQA57_00225 [Helicobacter anseris]|uniref:Anaphase-promoting protein n=1 Tax=Helicobacter anseris TaxID=375926 RepID=A0A3D8JBH8_9HELI|nr:tetratricopeptide repeat protein [Helicobacter anseris]RDU74515.1 hypothetical protein CQA57_00225 [Helicobacter anseris]
MAKETQEISSFNGDNVSQQTSNKKISLQKLQEIFFLYLEKFKQLQKKQKIFILCGFGAFIVILLLVLVFVFSGKKQKVSHKVEIQQEKQTTEEDIEITAEFLHSLPKVETSLSKIDDKNINALIQKANVLYDSGNKIEALNIFDKVATFSQALANYNLGVLQIKQKDYSNALKSFEKSLNSGENVSLSALNAAISARYMGDEKLYLHYLKLATNKLPEENQKPFYSYLYALVNFYNQNYFAALSSITNPITDSYIPMSAEIAAKTFLVFDDNKNAILALENQYDEKKDYKNLSLLYARIGEYDKAKSYLTRYLQNNQKDFEATMALQILYLKTYDFYQASNFLDQLSNDKAVMQKVNDIYPIKVVLQKRLFDVELAQRDFATNSLKGNHYIADRILFYFAPFKVFNVAETLDILRESGIFSNYNVTASEGKLVESKTIAQINKDIAQSLVAIYKNNLRQALKILKKAANSNPNHAILHYDLGLVYAQMDDLENAYKHFVKAYYLDSNNVESGLYAILASRFLDKDTQRMQKDITQDFDHIGANDPIKRKFLLSFFSYLNQSIADDMDWIEQARDKLPIYYALKGAFGIQTKNFSDTYQAFEKLDMLYHDDLIIKTIKNLAQGIDANFKQNALKLYNMIAKDPLNLERVYNGPALARQLYAYIGFITGSLKIQEDHLKEKLTASLQSPNGILQALALINLYQHKFDQAYAIYDTLINNLGESDTRTKFLSAVALIGTGNYDNAALLLQLSKMDAETNFETKFVLGMLYQQAGNFKAAASHYAMIAGKKFASSFFDFEIDTQKILDSKK